MMRRFTLFLFILSVFHGLTFAQNETNVWYFGYNAGLDFNSGAPIALEDGQTDGGEGVASICDNEGNLLFYTNSILVWRADHQVMTNGYGLYGSTNTIQSSIIVPNPSNNGIYYIFTLDTDAAMGGYTGLNYSEVDMNGFDGWGEVTDNKNIQLSDGELFEGLTAAKHANGVDVWVLTQKIENQVYEAYLVTEDGVTTTPIASDVSSVEPLGWHGTLKFSHDGTNVASVYGSKKAELLEFDAYSGTLDNAQEIDLLATAESWADSLATWSPYGIEFSPSDQYLYVSHLDYGPIVQYDLYADDLSLSRTPISPNFGTSANIPYCSLQLGPDGKIYAATWQEASISVINNPDLPASECDFEDNAITFEDAESSFGLPQFIQSFFVEAIFSYEEACKGDTAFFLATNEYDSLLWDFGDPESGENNYSTVIDPYHIYENEGSYSVFLTVYLDDDILTSTEVVNIPGPQLELAPGDTVCQGDWVELDATTPGAISYLWFDDSSNPTKWVQPPGNYWVTVDEGLCISTDSVYYDAGDCAYMSYPNIFTPNNDGRNDRFEYLQSWFVLKFSINIYDRWGKLVFTSVDPEESWDGTNLNGTDCADGVYFLSVRYSGYKNEVETIESTVQITRHRDR